MTRILYFNLNYQCNANCVFCVADVGLRSARPVPDINIFDIVAGTRRADARPGELVLFSGGEPTLFPDLLNAIMILKGMGQVVWIQTNGIRLANESFARALIESGVDRVSIPLYGPDAASHDRLTRCPGSFAKTTMGIRNVLGFRSKGQRLPVDLKLLVSKPTNLTNLDTLRYIHEELPAPDYVSIKHLVVSETVRVNGGALIPSVSDTKISLNLLIDYARMVNLEVRLFELPLCLLSKENARYVTDTYRRKCIQNSDVEFTYVDGGLREGRMSTYRIENCGQRDLCRLQEYCAGLEPSYIEFLDYDIVRPWADDECVASERS